MEKDLKVTWNRYFKEVYVKNNILFCGKTENVESQFSDCTQDELFNIEDTSWWFEYRAEVIHRIAQTFFDRKIPIFDLGGGNGYTTYYMQKRNFQMVLLEPTFGACKNAKKRGVETVICGTLTEDNVKDETMEQVFLLDVLEHIENDVEFLKLIHKKMIENGKILITVPAFSILWSSEDDTAGHYRRYRIKQIYKAAKEAGFSVQYANYFFEFLFLLILLVRVGMEKIGYLKRSEERTAKERKQIAEKQFKKRQGILQNVLYILERAEWNRLIKNKRVRWGSSILCVLEKVNK